VKNIKCKEGNNKYKKVEKSHIKKSNNSLYTKLVDEFSESLTNNKSNVENLVKVSTEKWLFRKPALLNKL